MMSGSGLLLSKFLVFQLLLKIFSYLIMVQLNATLQIQSILKPFNAQITLLILHSGPLRG